MMHVAILSNIVQQGHQHQVGGLAGMGFGEGNKGATDRSTQLRVCFFHSALEWINNMAGGVVEGIADYMMGRTVCLI